MAAPLAPHDPSYVVSVHTLYIDVLAQWADRSGLEGWMDAAAQDAFEKGLRVQSKAEDHSGLRWALAKFYSFSGRNGLALPALFQEYEDRRAQGQTYHVLKALDGIASAYSDMGQSALAHQKRVELRKLAKTYFKTPGVDPADGYEWLQYKAMLEKMMDQAASEGDAEAVRAIWKETEPIVLAVVSPEFPSYLRYAEHLSVVGEETEARRVVTQAKAIASREGHAEGVDVLCSEAMVETLSSNWDAADRLTDRCLTRWESEGFAPDPVKLRIRAEALEGTGALVAARDSFARAADAIDPLRASFSVADRAAFFSQRPIRATIHGQIRTATRVAATSRDAADFLAALSAAERMRARQLGDYLGADEISSLSPTRLAAIRAALPEKTVVLSYVLMDGAFVIHAFDRERFAAHVLPMDDGIPARLRALALRLSAPGSSQPDLEKELVALGRVFLGPVEPLLEGGGRLVVIPDGTLNLIPFDLLVDPGARKGLIDSERVVQLATSVRLLLDAGRGNPRETIGLFAAADPIYRSSYQSVGREDASIETSTRGLGLETSQLFAPLPETRREVESIAGLFGNQNVSTLLGSDALESRVKAADLTRYRYIHLATHGILGNEIPGVSEPAIVLGSEAGEDGLLLASEAMALDLSADLTVLSACKTGSGELVSGEGVLGMSRAFLIAGSRAVVVSLWAVDSLATEQLMVAFYERLREGAPPATALRDAKRSVRRESRKATGARGLREGRAGAGVASGRHPYYWSAFVLLGSLSEEN